MLAQAQRFIVTPTTNTDAAANAREKFARQSGGRRLSRGTCPPTNAVIRPVEERDAEAVAAIYAPHVTEGVASFELVPPDAAEMARRIAAHDGDLSVAGLRIAGAGVAGYVYAAAHNPRAAYQWSTNVTVYIDARHHRAGIGRALYASLFALLRLQGFYNAYGGITLPNAGSVGLHEAMGFRLVGIYQEVGYKFGRWWDVGWWALALQEKPSTRADRPVETGSGARTARLARRRSTQGCRCCVSAGTIANSTRNSGSASERRLPIGEDALHGILRLCQVRMHFDLAGFG